MERIAGASPELTTYTYDKHGNRTRQTTASAARIGSKPWRRAYEWHDTGMLAQVVQPGIAHTYTRDAVGRITTDATTTPDGVFDTSWVYDGLDPVVQSAASGALAAMVTDPTGLIALARLGEARPAKCRSDSQVTIPARRC